MPINEVTNKQRNFAIEYVRTGDATESYRKNYSTKGMRNTTICRKARELLCTQTIIKLVAKLRDHHEDIARELFEVDSAAVLEMYVAAATYDPADFADGWGNMRPFRDLTEAQRKMLQPKMLRNGQVVFMPPDREAARDALGKIMDLTNRVKVDSTVTVEDERREALGGLLENLRGTLATAGDQVH